MKSRAIFFNFLFMRGQSRHPLQPAHTAVHVDIYVARGSSLRVRPIEHGEAYKGSFNNRCADPASTPRYPVVATLRGSVYSYDGGTRHSCTASL